MKHQTKGALAVPPNTQMEAQPYESEVGHADQSAVDLDEIARSVHAGLNRMKMNVVEIGIQLLKAKAHLGHGRFKKWIDAEFGWDIRTAQNYMSVAARLGDKYERLSHLGLEALYVLAAPSTPPTVFDNVFEQAKRGEKISAAYVRALVKQGRPVKERSTTRSAVGKEVEAKSATRGGASTTARGQSDFNDPSRQLFELFKAKFKDERQRLVRIADLLRQCDKDDVVGLIDEYLEMTPSAV